MFGVWRSAAAGLRTVAGRRSVAVAQRSSSTASSAAAPSASPSAAPLSKAALNVAASPASAAASAEPKKKSFQAGALAACAGVWALGGALLYGVICVETSPAAKTEEAEIGDDEKEVLTSKFTYYSGRKLADPSKVMLFAGSGNTALAKDVAQYLGVKLGNIDLSRFADGECSIKVNENIRGKHVIIVQSTCPPNLNDALMELLLMIATMRRSSAKTITVVMPYCGYARSDAKRGRERSPIAARDTMAMLETMGADRLVSIDMHSGQMQGFLSPAVPSDNITAIKVGALYFAERLKNADNARNVVVVAPDEKAVSRAKEFWQVLLEKGIPEARFAMVLRKPNLEDKERKQRPSGSASASSDVESTSLEHEIVGDEAAIEGCDAIIVQDIVDSGQSMCNSASALKANGARHVYGFATHGLFSNNALDRIERAPIDHIVVSNTASTAATFEDKPAEKVTWISIAPLLAEVLRIISDKESLNPIFSLPKEPEQN
mmetsp:Transcript_434/g.1030  ORF Transcript_434/g.1030 Transcript_434/m.1030 type:complete len:491 (-) Transcript_434:414-1886(-)